MRWLALAVVCSGFSVAGVVSGRGVRRLAPSRARAVPTAGPVVRRWALSAVVGIMLLAVIGHGSAVPVAVVATIGAERLLRRHPRVRVRAGHAPDDGDLPVAAVLLAAVLEAGATVRVATAAVAAVVSAPINGLLRRGSASSALGLPPAVAWAPLGALSPLAAHLAAVLAEAESGGLPPVAALRALAIRAHASEVTSGRERAHRAGVRVVAPLGLCFLPAFVLVGIAPVAAGAFHSPG